MPNPVRAESSLRRHCRLLIAMSILTPILASCGGGGGGDGDGNGDGIGPFWVPTDVAVADMNGDGLGDIVTLAQYAASQGNREGRLIVHLQGVAAVAQTSIVGRYPWRLAMGDIDGDGAVDAAVVDVDGTRGVWVLLQDLDNRGRFLAAREVATGFQPYAIAIADLNGDAAPDLAVADESSGAARLMLLHQDPAQRGTFRPAVSLAVPGRSTTAVTTGDLDGDGRADLALAIALEPAGYTPRSVIGVSLQKADGTMGTVATLTQQTGLLVERMMIADYDADGMNDVFAYFRTSDAARYDPQLLVWLQGPTRGSFAVPASTSMRGLNGTMDAAIADLDGDDRPDAAVAGYVPAGAQPQPRGLLHRFAQSGGGMFAIVSTTEMSFDVSRVAAGDVDGDGRNDLVVLGSEDRYVVFR